jgi:hypothetical protein
MKKYLALAAVLGAIAFISVSYLAQAQTGGAAAPAAATAPAAPAVAAAPAADAAPAAAPVATFEQDNDTCSMISSAPTTEGAAPSAEAKDAAYKKCMIGKGHTEEELKKAADAKAAATPAAPAAPEAPAVAPAAPAEAPAAK